MKNFIRKSFVVALMVLPVLSQAAQTDCGGGTITAVRDNVGGTGLFNASVKFTQWYQPVGKTWINNSIALQMQTNQPKLITARASILAAFYSGSFVRFFAPGGMDCTNVDEVAVCKDEASCNVDRL